MCGPTLRPAFEMRLPSTYACPDGVPVNARGMPVECPWNARGMQVKWPGSQRRRASIDVEYTPAVAVAMAAHE
jgi:hypothetical protein